MPYLKHFDTLYEVFSHLILEGYSLKDYINGLCVSIFKNANTAYYGKILQNMSIIIINDLNPQKVDYTDESPEAYRDPVFVKVFCGGSYNPVYWTQQPTMAVDLGRNVYIGEQFLAEEIFGKAKDNKDATEIIKGILMHESMHISDMSFFRQGNRLHLPWNIATDAYINYQLVNNGIKLPEFGIIPDKDGFITYTITNPDGSEKELKFQIKGKTAEILYDEIVKLFKNETAQQPQTIKRPPLKRGDPVYNKKTNECGVIISTNPYKIRIITKEEAKIRADLAKKGIFKV